MNEFLQRNISEEDNKNLTLSYLQFYGLLILFLGCLVNIKSSKENIEIILRKYNEYNTPAPAPLETALLGSKLFLIGLAILLYVSLIRQEDLKKAYNHGFINDEIYETTSDLNKVTIIGIFAIFISFISIRELIEAQQINEPVQEEEFIF